MDPDKEFTEEPDDAYLFGRALLATLGLPGRMIAASKSNYTNRHPDRVAIFNANVVLSPLVKAWHGDIDLTLAEPLLHELARLTGRIVYLLYEFDGRFENEHAPRIENAVFSVTPTGHTRFRHEQIERTADGFLRPRTACTGCERIAKSNPFDADAPIGTGDHHRGGAKR